MKVVLRTPRTVSDPNAVAIPHWYKCRRILLRPSGLSRATLRDFSTTSTMMYLSESWKNVSQTTALSGWCGNFWKPVMSKIGHFIERTAERRKVESLARYWLISISISWTSIWKNTPKNSTKATDGGWTLSTNGIPERFGGSAQSWSKPRIKMLGKNWLMRLSNIRKTGCTCPLSMKWTRDIDGLSMWGMPMILLSE